MDIHVGDEVGWQWGSGIATGFVIAIKPEKTTIETKGTTVTRNGTADDPAVTIKHASGNLVLKRAHELQVITNEEEKNDASTK
ncbi:MAG TPA: DUF2945 domain-containing protein [Candidatus Saccharimonadales bacterium]|nr:DUF2945 domain-containing protein [Candidatus Saccharimonadales bacterium]